jgi:hypothetical protein
MQLEWRHSLVFSEDFESYADQTALNLVWINGSAAVSSGLTNTTPADGVILTNSRSFLPPSTGTKSGATRWAHDRRYVNLATTVTAGTPDTPGQAALMTVYMYRDSISTTAGATRNHTLNRRIGFEQHSCNRLVQPGERDYKRCRGCL